jgi:hypothetical protein
MFVKSKLTQKSAIEKIRFYTGKTCLRRLKILVFSLVHAGGLCVYSSDSTAWREPYYIRTILLKHPLNTLKVSITQIVDSNKLGSAYGYLSKLL